MSDQSWEHDDAGRVILELMAERDRLREALTKIRDLPEDADRTMREIARAAIDNRLHKTIALAKEAGQPQPGYRKGDICQSADGTIWHCVEDGITAKWERGKPKEAGK